MTIIVPFLLHYCFLLSFVTVKSECRDIIYYKISKIDNIKVDQNAEKCLKKKSEGYEDCHEAP